ncbi:MAG: FAD-dependent oxidoreductase [Pseudomonadota bacterium]
MEIQRLKADVLVIGAGGAGMYAALSAAKAGARQVILLDKNMIGRGGATIMAQMTVAAALSEAEPDEWEWHLADTLEAGRGLCDPKLAALLCREGPVRMREMDEWGVGWAREGDSIAQVMAPGHGVKRCCYVDFLSTGPAVSQTLRNRVSRSKEIRRVSNLTITELLINDERCCGAFGYDVSSGVAVSIEAGATIIATGGLTKLYARNSASTNMAGEGYALALNAGAELIDMEFVQFFPIGHLAPRLVGMDPIMWDPFRYKLGGLLLNGEHEEFVHRYADADEGNYKITRDQATFAILSEVAAGRGSPHGGAYLSFAHLSEDRLREAFGPVIDRLADNGIDLTSTAVEVSPIAHYHMGGIRVNEKMQSTIAGLYAAGEAVGGANGANRLSGNAITEALVFGDVAGREAALEGANAATAVPSSAEVWAADRLSSMVAASDESPDQQFNRLQGLMWDSVGPFRDAKGLEFARDQIDGWGVSEERQGQVTILPFDMNLASRLELRAALTSAKAVIASALAREESRGAHQRRDFQEMNDEAWHCSQRIKLHEGTLVTDKVRR